MKKSIALILGITLSLTSIIPFTSAFASNDPGLSNYLTNCYFGWYSNFPYADANGYLYNTAFPTGDNYVNGVHDTSYSMGTYAAAPNPGDYIMYSMASDVLSNYGSSVWIIEVLIPETQSFNSDAFDASVIIDGYEVEAFYQYCQLHIEVDSRYYTRFRFMFSTFRSGVLSFKLTATKSNNSYFTPVLIRFQGMRTTNSGYTEAEMVQIQASLVNAFNVAALADAIGNIDTSQVDLSTLEATTQSILQALSDVPDIISYIDQIETNQSNILNAINTFYNFYADLFSNINLNTNINYTAYDLDGNVITTDATRASGGYYMVFPYQSWFNNNFIRIRFQTRYNVPTSVKYQFTSETNIANLRLSTWQDMYFDIANTETMLIIFGYIYPRYVVSGMKLIVKVEYDGSNQVFITTNQSYHHFGYRHYDLSWYQRIETYFKQLLGLGGGNNIPSGIQETTDTVTEQVQGMTQFEDTYNQSLESSASQIDVSSYEIQQTQGMQFMRTYTELNFDRMQQFRILFLTPLILALAAFFLRRRS